MAKTELRTLKSVLYRDGQKNCTLTQSAIPFFHRDNNLKFLPFSYNDILRSCLKFYDEIPRGNKMTAI